MNSGYDTNLPILHWTVDVESAVQKAMDVGLRRLQSGPTPQDEHKKGKGKGGKS